MTQTMPVYDLHYVLARVPKDVRELVRNRGLAIAGGFVRAIIAGEKPSDIDVWGPSKDALRAAAMELAATRGVRMHETHNAWTIVVGGRMAVQFVHRWCFAGDEFSAFLNGTNLEALLDSFDFTVAQAGIHAPDGRNWLGLVGERFYPDLASRRLYYVAPHRHEDAGGSLLRVRKFLQKGYHIEIDSLARVAARLVMGVRPDARASSDEDWVGKVMMGLLREVDPLMVVDGVEVAEDPDAAPMPDVSNDAALDGDAL
mgnify:CR=1 FL=1